MIFSDDRESTLTRAVLISLFTWRRALTDDPVDDDELFGWWGDSYPNIADDRIGSRLWLLRRVKLTDATQRDAEFYAQEALRWLLDEGQALAIEITSEKAEVSRLNLTVVITVPGGDRIEIKPLSSWQVIYAV